MEHSSQTFLNWGNWVKPLLVKYRGLLENNDLASAKEQKLGLVHAVYHGVHISWKIQEELETNIEAIVDILYKKKNDALDAIQKKMIREDETNTGLRHQAQMTGVSIYDLHIKGREKVIASINTLIEKLNTYCKNHAGENCELI